MLTLLIALAAVQADDAAARDAANAALIAANYPVELLKHGEQGAVAFRVTLDNRGRLVSCAVTHSNGFRRLDEATCDVIARTAYFQRMRDGNGVGIASAHDGQVNWVLPGNVAPTATPIAVTQVPEKIICKRQALRGSLVITQKVCLTTSDWDRQRLYAQQETKSMQSDRNLLPGQ